MSKKGKLGDETRWNEWTVAEVYHLLTETIKAGFSRTIFLWGPPAIGKSMVTRQACEDTQRRLVDRRLSMLDPADVRGVLMPGPDGKAVWLNNPDWGLESKDPFVILLDEHNHAPDLVQKASYEIALDHAVGQTPFPEGTVIVLAGNREIDNANVTPMDRPMQSRVIHCYVRFDAQTWLDWATTRGQIHPAVLSYLKERPDKINCPAGELKEYYGEPLPRTWEFASDCLRTFQDNVDKILAGCIGPGESIEFTAWMKTAGQLTPLIDAIEKGKNEVAEEMSQQFFVCQSLVERFRRRKKLSKRILEYAIATKDKCPEVAGLMIQSAYHVDRDALKSDEALWKRMMKFFAKIFA